MDDGTHRDHRACRLCTQSFSAEDHDLLIECLRDNFGILAKKKPITQANAGVPIAIWLF